MVFVIDCVVLGFAGSQPAEGLWLILAQIGTFYYFAHFLLVLPLLSVFETPKALPTSISKPVLAGGGGMVGAPAKPMEKA